MKTKQNQTQDKTQKQSSRRTGGRRLFSQNSLTVIGVVVAYIVIAALLYSGNVSRQVAAMLIPVSCYIVLAVSLNLVVGLLGELSLGHAGFMAVGIFTGCLFSIATVSLPMAIRLPVSMLIGGICAAAVGFVVGLPALRLKGDYLAIVTLACGEIIKTVILNLDVTGGAMGLNTQPIYSSAYDLLPYAALMVLLTVVAVMNLKKSRHGRAIMAIRDNRIAAESTGINVTYYKLMVFVLAAFLAGAVGVLYGHTLAVVSPTSFDYNMSIEILVIVVLGGMGNITGSIIATVILRVLPEALRGLDDFRMLIYSLLLITIMLLNANPKFASLKGQWSVKNFIQFLKHNKKKEQTAQTDAKGGTAE